MFKVVHSFKDLQDDEKLYKVGDKYPRAGYKPTEKRIAELLGKRNKIGEPLIKEVEKPKKSKTSETKRPVKKQAGK